jgi:hypothetical protein
MNRAAEYFTFAGMHDEAGIVRNMTNATQRAKHETNGCTLVEHTKKILSRRKPTPRP